MKIPVTGRLFCLLFSLPCTLLFAQESHSFDREKMNAFFDTLYSNDIFMGKVAIDSGGEIVYSRAEGLSGPDGERVKEGDHSLYRIGSISKTYTAVMIVQLVREGKLSLEDKLAGFYPQIPRAEDITIRHLLEHQSGLYNFTNSEDYREWMTQELTKGEMLSIFEKGEPQFSPGEKTSYSNTNYVLLSYILEDVCGEEYPVILEERIAEPLGLENTYAGEWRHPRGNEVISFAHNGNSWEEASRTHLCVAQGAGSVLSEPEEMITFIRALFSGKLMPPEWVDTMTAGEQWGMGLVRFPFADKFAWGHNGGIDGFHSSLAYFPEEDVTVVYTDNGLNYSMNEILVGMLSIYFGKDFELPSFHVPTVELDQEQLARYTGYYEPESEDFPVNIEIRLEDGELTGQATGQNSFPLFPSDEKTLNFTLAGIVMEFDSLENGRYTKMIFQQGGGSWTLIRSEEKRE